MTTQAPHIEREPSSRRAAVRDILTRLKAETAAEHSAIEAATGIMHPELGLEAYRAYLERTYGFYQPVEAMLTRLGVWSALGLDPSPRVKLPLLIRDLRALGSDPASLPICEQPPVLGSVAEAAGCSYVLEGSTLGGRVISKHVQARLGAHAPREFLDGYGASTGESWQAFRAALRAFADTPEREARAIVGAKQTFATFTRWLERA
jgi:heme oxygenase (biliverdin-IX-beta and delta-forming)